MSMGLLLPVALVAIAYAEAPPDPAVLIAKTIAHDTAQAPLAEKYVHREEITHGETSKSGKKEPDRTETFDVLFLGGSPYRKLVLENGKPLAAAKQAKVNAELEKERSRRAGQKRGGLLHRTVYFAGMKDLPRLCNLTVTEAVLDGREVWKLEALPRPDAKPLTAEDRGALSTKVDYWIDKNEFAVVKDQRTFLTAQAGLQPGATLTTDYGKIQDECWLPVRFFLATRFKPVMFVDVNLTTETRFVDYRKFDVSTSVEFQSPNN